MSLGLSIYSNFLALPYSGKKKRERKLLFFMQEKMISNSRFPPGIRFHPSDQELITYYLQRKVNSLPLPADVISDIELYNYNPWDLPRKALFGDDEWYFFTPRDRKYPNGARPNRTAASGYWKATGTDKPIISSSGSRRIGVKKALVFYQGKPPKGIKMDWIMTEYRVLETPRPLRSRGSMRLDDWVLCRIRQKGNMSKNAQEDDQNSCEYQEYLSKIDKLPAVSTNDGRDMLADYLKSSEFHLVTSLLTGQDPSQGSNNNRTIHEHRVGKLNNQASFSLFQSLINSTSHKNMHVNFQQPTMMIMDEPEDDSINMQDLYMPASMDDFIR